MVFLRITILLAVAMFLGCVTMKYDASSGSFAYNRFGNQELIDLRIEKTVSATKVSLNRATSDTDIKELIELLRAFLEGQQQ